MKVWKYVLRETGDNPLNADFTRGFVKADTLEEAQTKVEAYMKRAYKNIKLEITSLCFELEVNLE